MHELTAATTVLQTAWRAQDDGSARMVTGLEGDASLAQDGADPAAPGGTGGTGAGGGGPMFLIVIVMMVVLLGMTALSGRKEKKRHREMVGALQKKDKVRAAGGIIGTIVEVKDDELLIETDRSSNTRIRVARSSVQGVLSSGGAGAAPEPASED